MLVLSCKVGRSIIARHSDGTPIVITVVPDPCGGGRLRLGITAPPSVRVVRDNAGGVPRSRAGSIDNPLDVSHDEDRLRAALEAVMEGVDPAHLEGWTVAVRWDGPAESLLISRGRHSFEWRPQQRIDGVVVYQAMDRRMCGRAS
jgi:sRNA-binding carbon storage regulator CsrA